MAAYFVDLDGTTFRFGTNEFLPNARENLLARKQAGHQIIFTTMRDDAADVREVLKQAGLGGMIITGVQSPRIVINDDGAYAVNHQTDAPWNPV
jgi:hydroxymethylpyrimidine pyrophosphatase-like HAD family hydrolase